MGERENLTASIANTIKTYRSGELDRPTPAHVERWANQFTPVNQLPFLREFDHVIRQTFLTKKAVADFLGNLVRNEQLVGKDPKAYWARANVLRIQKNGQSQKEMTGLFAEAVGKQCSLKLSKCGTDAGDYIYLDDVIFSGGRVVTDLQAWIADKAPKNATVHVIVMAYHTLGQFFADKRLTEAAAKSRKTIKVRFWRLIALENRKFQKDNSNVLWPTAIPNDAQVQAYIAAEKKYPWDPRKPGGSLGMFSSEAGRQVLESEFLIAGVKIRSLTQSPRDFVRPLGLGNFGVGFGSLIATYRNCPNNCPLALWWGDPEATSGALHWYPLLRRKTYATLESSSDDGDDLPF
ncbi:MAG: hypothetical protein JSR56_06320 [Proteobacteria bacterium]|nr:hypothetical protein [Pseudomonadota bacterium]